MSQAGRHRAPGRHAKPKTRNPKKWLTPALAVFLVLAVSGSTYAHRSAQTPEAAPTINPTALAVESSAAFGASTLDQSKTIVTKPVPTKFTVKVVKDPNLATGVKKVVTPGRNGAAVVKYLVSRVNGKEVSRSVLSRKVIAPARQQIVVQGIGDPDKTQAALNAAEAHVDTVAGAQHFAKLYIADQYGWSDDQFSCLVDLWNRESHWRVAAHNKSGAFGIPQALPGQKMSSAGADWQTNAATQIRWGAGYIENRYGTPCDALGHSNATGWY